MRFLIVISLWLSRHGHGVRVTQLRARTYPLEVAGTVLFASLASSASGGGFTLIPLQERPVMGADGKTLELGLPAIALPSSVKDGIPQTAEPFQLKNFASLQNQMAMGFLTLTDTRDEFFSTWDIGIDHNIAEGHYHVYSYEVDVGWKHNFNESLTTVVGWRFANEEGTTDRAFAGVEWWIPGGFRSSWQVDGMGDLRVGLAKSYHLTKRLEWFSAARYDTGTQWAWTTGLDYELSGHFSLVAQYHSGEGMGLGLGFRF
jgi:hypothetical protein